MTPVEIFTAVGLTGVPHGTRLVKLEDYERLQKLVINQFESAGRAVRSDVASALAHRACCAEEHDSAVGKLHGCCVVCGVPWPCDTAKSFLRSSPVAGPLKLDNDRQVFFYEQDHYYLSNFSAFEIQWHGKPFPTSEHVYHWEKFIRTAPDVAEQIRFAASAHEAFKLAELHKGSRRTNWDEVKVEIMRRIIRAKVEQHEYVRRKLLQTGDRELIENSWRDDYWGWGPNRDGKNMLGKLWMEVRAELKAQVIL